jgi:hypothetical protein
MAPAVAGDRAEISNDGDAGMAHFEPVGKVSNTSMIG